eukprot:gene2437-3148_t
MIETIGEDCSIQIFLFLNGIDITKLKRVSKLFLELIEKKENFLFENLYKNELNLNIIKEHFIQQLVPSLSEKEKEKEIPKLSNFKSIYKQYLESQKEFKEYKDIQNSKELITNLTFLPKFESSIQFNLKKKRYKMFNKEEKEISNNLTNDTNEYFMINSSIFSNYFDILSINNNNLIKRFEGHSGGIIETITLFSNPFENILNLQKNNNINLIETTFEESNSNLFNNRIISSSTDLSIKIWNFKNEKCISTIYPNHTSYTIKHCLNKTCLISGSHESNLKLFDLNTLKLLDESNDHLSCIYNLRYDQISSIVTSSKDGKILLFDLKQKILKLKNKIITNDTSPIYSMDLNGYHLVFGNKNKKLEFRDLRLFEKPLKILNENKISTHLKLNQFNQCFIANEDG